MLQQREIKRETTERDKERERGDGFCWNLTDFAVPGRIINKILTDLHGQVDVTGAIPEQWNADELRRRFERHFLVWPRRFEDTWGIPQWTGWAGLQSLLFYFFLYKHTFDQTSYSWNHWMALVDWSFGVVSTVVISGIPTAEFTSMKNNPNWLLTIIFFRGVEATKQPYRTNRSPWIAMAPILGDAQGDGSW